MYYEKSSIIIFVALRVITKCKMFYVSPLIRVDMKRDCNNPIFETIQNAKGKLSRNTKHLFSFLLTEILTITVNILVNGVETEIHILKNFNFCYGG